MISMFGIISIAVALVSILAIVLHNRVMKRRTAVDYLTEELETLLRDRLGMLHRYSRPGTQLRELCDVYMDLELESILFALPEITAAFEDAKEAGSLVISEPLEEEPEQPEASYVSMARLESNADAIFEKTEALNQAIEVYNAFITHRLPEGLMARVLGLEVQELV